MVARSSMTPTSRSPRPPERGHARFRRVAGDARSRARRTGAPALLALAHADRRAPRRYNTWFFVAAAPEGEDGAHDDSELVASGWVRPVDALAQHVAGEIDLIFPTEMSLRVLARYEFYA